MATATTEPVRLPPGPGGPKTVQAVALFWFVDQNRTVAALARRYGSTFSLSLPIFGQTVVISDPTHVKDLFSTSRNLLGRAKNNLGEIIGPGSLFNLEGDELLERRKLVLPPFHGNRVQSYEQLIEEEVMREVANWPQGREFETLPSMSRITLNAILRAVFGAEGPALDELRALILPAVELGSRIAFLPPIARRDLGRWSPKGRLLQYRRRIDAIINSIIADARADPAFEERKDVLSLLLQARYENGEPIPDPYIIDELVTLLVAGYETTSAQLAWAVERLRRHPRLLARLTEEVDAGGSELRQATIWEVQRTRPVLIGALRRTKTRIRLGEWVLPEDTMVWVGVQLAHDSEESFPDAMSFNPDRFAGAMPNPFAWIAFGGGMNRCIGAPFANMEIDITLRTLLREFRFVPTDAPGERRHNRGVTIAPGRGGRAAVYRRTADASSDADSVSVADPGSRRLQNR
jgi:cytochrome P450